METSAVFVDLSPWLPNSIHGDNVG